MPVDAFVGLISFALIGSMTPGPNNVMLLASGVNFGFRRTVPHMVGIAIGCVVLLLAVGAGLGVLLVAFPILHLALKIVGGAYLLYLAYKIATTRKMARGRSDERPMNFWEAAAFQWVNPKAWIMAVTAVAGYADTERPLVSIAVIMAVFLAFTILSVTTWSAFGMALKDFLSEPVRLKWFNILTGFVLAATVVPMLA